jgi:hypothetical protein
MAGDTRSLYRCTGTSKAPEISFTGVDDRYSEDVSLSDSMTGLDSEDDAANNEGDDDDDADEYEASESESIHDESLC